MPGNILIGSARYGGQEPRNGVTVAVANGTSEGDVIAPTAAAATVGQAADGAEPTGVLTKKEADGLGTWQSFEVVQVVRVTGAVTTGIRGITGDGAGGIKVVAAGTANSLRVIVLGTQTISGQAYAAVVRQ